MTAEPPAAARPGSRLGRWLRRGRAPWQSEQLLAAVYANAPVGLFSKDLQRRFTSINRHLLQLNGLSEQVLLGHLVEEFWDDPSIALVREQDEVVLVGGTVSVEEEIEVQGTVRTFNSLKFPLRDRSGRVTGIGGIMTDTTERVAVDRALRRSEARLRELFVHGPVPQLVLGLDGRLLQVNPALQGLLGRGDLDGVLLVDLVHPDDVPVAAELVARLAGGPGRTHLALRLLRRGAPSVHAALTVAVVAEEGATPYAIGMVQDVTAERRAAAELQRQALTDELTGLPNRALLDTRLSHALAEPERPVAVLFLDLDGFKEVNDSLGHDAGDLLLQAVADRLGAVLRPGDTLARLGGDEFVLCCPGVEDDDTAELLAARVLEALADPFPVGGREVQVGGSVGCARGRGADGATPRVLLRDADTALYAAKAAGRGRWSLFHPALRERDERRRRLEGDLRAALRDGTGLALVYQPVVDLVDGRVRVVEALLRWTSPHDGAVPPEALLAVARGCGLLGDVDRWVLGEACRAAARWTGPDGEPVRVAVNVSAPTVVDGSLVADVAQVCRESGLQPSRLVVELTETAAVEQPAATARTLARLRELGARVALDDFGTGFSSLSHLRDLPVDVVKVDRSFTAGVVASARDAALVSSMVDLARALGARVVAEGVEDADQEEAVRLAGCDAVQGWHRGAGVPAELVPALLGPPVPAMREPGAVPGQVPASRS